MPCECPSGSLSLQDWAAVLRLPHWLKNSIVLPAVLLLGMGGEPTAWMQAAWAFAAFCLAASAVYVLNDWFDRDRDRRHPRKRRRPIAAGRVGLPFVLRTAPLLAAAAGVVALAGGGSTVRLCIVAYLLLNLAYDVRLKHVPVLDVLSVGSGFGLRVLAVTTPGTDDARAALLLGCTVGLCTFVAACKRTAEVLEANGAGAGNGNHTAADGYTPRLLHRLLLVTGCLTAMLYAGFAWYVGDGRLTIQLTIVPVLVCLLRLGHLARHGHFRDLFEVMRSDRPLLATGACWACLWLAGTFA